VKVDSIGPLECGSQKLIVTAKEFIVSIVFLNHPVLSQIISSWIVVKLESFVL